MISKQMFRIKEKCNMADTYWDDSWGERLPFLEDAPKEEVKKEKKGLSAEVIEQYLDSIHMAISDEE